MEKTLKKLLVSTLFIGSIMSCSNEKDPLESTITPENPEVTLPNDSTEVTNPDSTVVVEPGDSVAVEPAPPVDVELTETQVLLDGKAVEVTYWIEPGQSSVNGNDIPAGSVVAFRPSATPRGRLYFNYLIGTESKPITIINKDQVVIAGTESGKHAVGFIGCQNIRVLGSGNPNIKYGIHIAESGSSGMTFDQKSTGVEVAYAEIENTGFAGILCKTDNAGSGWTMSNIKFHHNHIHDTHGEGIYLGQTAVANAHPIKNVRIHHNLIHDTGWDLFQVANVTGDIEVYNNTMINGGKENEPMQNQGFQIGDWSTGKYYNNIVSGSKSRFLFMKGGHDIDLYNNYFSSVESDSEGTFLKTEAKYVTSAVLDIHDNWFRDYQDVLFKSMITVHEVRIHDNKINPRNNNGQFIVYSSGASDANHKIENNPVTNLPAIELNSDYTVKSGSYYDGYSLGYEANDNAYN
ncbi:right-handed parallel beta-helix repeat-containing protein [Limibacter armeniacum]|uniref:right-handed parallel beta-helix repeat-containing protein n=1 Tax=Limibacter armeniacum TaxID=466084 RepID=UPI002FE630F6